MRFYLTTSGYLFFRAFPMPNDMCKFYIREQIDKRYWSPRSQKVLMGQKGSDQINAIIRKVKDITETTIRDGKIKGKAVTSAELKEILSIAIFGDKKETTPSLRPSKTLSISQYVDIYLRRHKPPTAKAYRSKMKTILEIFPRLEWADITISWKYIAIDAMKKKGFSDNYISKLISVVRTVVNAAIEEGITEVKIPTKLVPTPTKVDTIYITHDDIMRMYRYQYPNEYQTNAVRLWVLLYCTGQRVSDMSSVLNSNQLVVKMPVPISSLQSGNQSSLDIISNVSMIRFMQKKTGKMISLPFNDIMTELWATPPRIISAQKLNKYIKEAATIAGIQHGDIISSHAARRSCATNLVLSGVPISIVMDITGHTTERECMRYVRYDDIAGAIRIGKNESFLQLFRSIGSQ